MTVRAVLKVSFEKAAPLSFRRSGTPDYPYIFFCKFHVQNLPWN